MDRLERNVAGNAGAVVAELEGTLLLDSNLFPYLSLVSFEASTLGLLRFALLLLVWPVVWVLGMLGMGRLGLDIMIFVTVAGVRASEVEAVARAVLPKFFVDDVCMPSWMAFAGGSAGTRRKVVVTRCPRVLVDRFAREHLEADAVVHGGELEVNRFGLATGFVRRPEGTVVDRVKEALAGETPVLGLGRRAANDSHLVSDDDENSSFLSLCKEQRYPPLQDGHDGAAINDDVTFSHLTPPRPVVFHDGRLVRRPTPSTALLILLWIPLGFILSISRIAIGVLLPMRLIPYLYRLFGDGAVVNGERPPPPEDTEHGGVLYVCTHRSLMDPVILANVLGRRVPAVTYSISRLTEILAPIPTIRLSRDRDTDAQRIKQELSKGELVIFPEGTTCREPFLLRFSALFAELTDKIVPVAINYRVGFFHATTARGWKALDFVFFFMNPRPVYEVTFLNQLPHEVTCSAGKSSYDVANYVQRILAASLGFQCTSFTRKDKYRLLAGNDGSVDATLTRPRNTVATTGRSQLLSFLGLARVC